MIVEMADNQRQHGFVAIFSVLMIMGVLTLLAIGFSNITRQAQRRALDDQLSTQAFYAAESGVNRAQTLANSGTLTNKSDCTSDNTLYNYNIDITTGVSLSCILVDMDPTDIYAAVPVIGSGEPYMTYLRSTSGSDISSFRISFDGTSTGTERPNSTWSSSNLTLPSYGNWNVGGVETIGIIRIDLLPVPTSGAGNLARQASVDSGYTFFLYPSTDPSATNSLVLTSAGTANKGVSQLVNCGVTNSVGLRCEITVTPQGVASNAYYLRAVSYYNATQLNVAPLGVANEPMEISDSQALVDSTGRAVDTSRRIQVRISLHDNPGLHEPFSLLSANSLCKQFLAINGASQYDPAGIAAQDQTVCNINSD